MTRSVRVLIAAALIAAGSIAQTITSAVTGSVVDAGGLAVTGAEVLLHHTATGAVRQTITNELGDFYFGSVTPGEYSVAVTRTGFKKAERTNVQVSASETVPLGRIQLEVGQLTESVTVTASAALIQTASAERAGTITSKQVDSVLIRGRNVMSLLQLLPGVIDNGEQESLSRDWNINVNGNRRNTSSVSLDGMALNAIGNNNNATVGISQDAVAEVRVLLSNYQAEFGRMSGANIQLVTKSGSRDFHGLASYYKRHEQFNANNFFNNLLGQRKPRYRYNTWNYNVGGPVTIPGVFNKNREKLFFFWSQEFWPIKVARPISQLTVPTELERAGNFSQSLDLNGRQIVVRDPDTRAPFPGNVVAANRLDPNGLALLKVFPQPNFFDRGISAGRYNYVFVGQNETPQKTDTLKLDYNLSPKNVISGTYNRYSDQQKGAVGIASSGGTNWEQLRKMFDNQGKAFVGRYQRIFSPTVVNELNIGFVNRPANDVVADEELKRNLRSTVGFSTPQLNPASNPLGVIPNATFGGVSQPANLTIEGRFPLVSTHDSMTVSNNLTSTMRAHTVKVGFYWDRIWRNADNAVVFNGDYNFAANANNPLDTGYAYANAALGVFNSYSEASARPFAYFRLSNAEWFAQDNWRVTRRLTLDYGMRMSIVYPLYEDRNNVASFFPSRWDASKAPRLIEPVRVNNVRMGRDPVTGQTYPVNLVGALVPGTGDPANGMVRAADDPTVPRSFIKNRGVQWAPRVGFAWDVFGNSKTAVRGGFGMFYNRQNLDAVLNPFTTLPPIVQTPVVNFGTLRGLGGTSGGVLFPQNVFGLDGEGKIPTVMNFSLSVQQNIGFNTVLDVGYVGSLGRHLMWQRNLNAIPFGANFLPENQDASAPASPLPPALLRPIRGYNNINVREWASSSNYHSMQVHANRRFSAGLQFIASWTWSKSMDFNSNDTDAVSPLVDVRVWNYGLSSYDRTHVAKFSGVWDLPKSGLQNPVMKQIADGWQLSGIVSFASGQPLAIGYTTTTAVDITGSPTDGARIVLTGEPSIPRSERTRTRFFDTSVVRLPARGTIGNAGKFNLRGPGINNTDLALFKTFNVREPLRLQFRWETYNTWNHTQFSAVDTTARFDPQGNQVNGRLGELTAARAARIMQFALRFYF